MAKVKYLTVPFNYDLYNRFCDKLLDYYFFCQFNILSQLVFCVSLKECLLILVNLFLKMLEVLDPHSRVFSNRVPAIWSW